MTQADYVNRTRTSMVARQRGFTLFELAVVIVIISLLLGLVIAPLASQNAARQLRAERNAQQEIRDALIGHAIVNGALPCPDTDTSPPDGVGNRVGGAGTACSANVGLLPWTELGVQGEDTWGWVYQYRVSSQFALPSTPGTPVPNATGLDLGDAADINVNDFDDNKATVLIANNVAAIILSVGPNGYGGRNIEGDASGAPPAGNVNEAENLDGDVNFVSRNHTPVSNGCNDAVGSTGTLFCEFDDVLTWVPPSLLFLRMVQGGALP